jgi:hypothetical protein
MLTLTPSRRRHSTGARLACAAVVALLLLVAIACHDGVTEPDPDTDTQLHLRDLPSSGTLVGSLSTAFTTGPSYVPPAPFRKALGAKGASPSVKWLAFSTDDDLTPKSLFGGSFTSRALGAQRIDAGLWQLRVSGDRMQVGDEVDIQGALFLARDAGNGRFERRATIADFKSPSGYNFCYGNTSSRIVVMPGAAVDAERGDVLVLELWAVLTDRHFAHGPTAVLRLTYDGAIDGATQADGGCGTGSLNNDSRLDPPRPLAFQ